VDSKEFEFEKLAKEEKKATEAALADVVELLSHDTSSTRRQLILVLQGRIQIITAEIGIDNFLNYSRLPFTDTT
jgi:hypothetical protein